MSILPRRFVALGNRVPARPEQRRGPAVWARQGRGPRTV